MTTLLARLPRDFYDLWTMTRDDLQPMGELAGTIAHDFNNLLAAIRGYAELAQQGIAEDDQAWGDLEQLQRAVDRGEELTGQLHEFSRKLLETGASGRPEAGGTGRPEAGGTGRPEAGGTGRPEGVSATAPTLQRLLAEAGLQDA